MPFTQWLMACMPCSRLSVLDIRYEPQHYPIFFTIERDNIYRVIFLFFKGLVWKHAAHRWPPAAGISDENQLYRCFRRDYPLWPEWRLAWQVRHLMKTKERRRNARFHTIFFKHKWMCLAGMKSWTSSRLVWISMLTSMWEAGIRVAWRWMMRKYGATAVKLSNQSALSPVKRLRSR